MKLDGVSLLLHLGSLVSRCVLGENGLRAHLLPLLVDDGHDLANHRIEAVVSLLPLDCNPARDREIEG